MFELHLADPNTIMDISVGRIKVEKEDSDERNEQSEIRFNEQNIKTEQEEITFVSCGYTVEDTDSISSVEMDSMLPELENPNGMDVSAKRNLNIKFNIYVDNNYQLPGSENFCEPDTENNSRVLRTRLQQLCDATTVPRRQKELGSCVYYPTQSNIADVSTCTNRRDGQITMSSAHRRPMVLSVSESKQTSMSVLSKQNSFTCSVCQMSFPLKVLLMDHSIVHSRERLFHCKVSKQNSFTCSVCRMSFPLKVLLMDHSIVHSRERLFHCKVCKAQFLGKAALLHHSRIHKPFACTICDELFTRKDYFLCHMRIHTGADISFSCTVCDKSFTTKDMWLHHSRSHKGPVSCNFCKKSFSQSSHLLRHVQMYSLKKAYSCDVCEKSFAHECNLLKHKVIHGEKRSFYCNICKTPFALKEEFISHMTIHAKEQPCILTNF